jgi:hypothetical protein
MKSGLLRARYKTPVAQSAGALSWSGLAICWRFSSWLWAAY